MGYATHYTLEHTEQNAEAQAHIHAALLAIDEAGYCLAIDAPGQSYPTAGGGKWYDHESDLRAVSASFPGVLFTLHGEGEEPRDVWAKYFRDGKCQVAKAEIHVADFDPGRLR